MKLSKNIFLLLATGNSTTNGMEKDHNSDNTTMEHNPTEILASCYAPKKEEKEHKIEPNSITNGMENDPFNVEEDSDAYSVPTRNKHDPAQILLDFYNDNSNLFCNIKDIQNQLELIMIALEKEYKIVKEEYGIIQAKYEEWQDILKITCDGETCLRNLMGIQKLSHIILKDRLSKLEEGSFWYEGPLLCHDEIDKLDEDPQNTQAIEILQMTIKKLEKEINNTKEENQKLLKENNLAHCTKTLQICNNINELNKDPQNIAVVEDLRSTTYKLKKEVNNIKNENNKCFLKISKWEKELHCLESMVKEKKYNSNKIKKHLNGLKTYTHSIYSVSH